MPYCSCFTAVVLVGRFKYQKVRDVQEGQLAYELTEQTVLHHQLLVFLSCVDSMTLQSFMRCQLRLALVTRNAVKGRTKGWIVSHNNCRGVSQLRLWMKLQRFLSCSCRHGMMKGSLPDNLTYCSLNKKICCVLFYSWCWWRDGETAFIQSEEGVTQRLSQGEFPRQTGQLFQRRVHSWPQGIDEGVIPSAKTGSWRRGTYKKSHGQCRPEAA